MYAVHDFACFVCKMSSQLAVMLDEMLLQCTDVETCSGYLSSSIVATAVLSAASSVVPSHS